MIKAEDGSKFDVAQDAGFSHRVVLLTITKADGTEDKFQLLPYDAEILAMDLQQAARPKK